MLAARGVTDPQSPDQVIKVINYGNDGVELPAGFTIGTCESVEETCADSDEPTPDDTSLEDQQPSMDNDIHDSTEIFSRQTTATEESEGTMQKKPEASENTEPESDLPDYLLDLWIRCCEHLTAEESLEVARLLREYADVFAKSDDDLGRTSYVKHTVRTGNATPKREPPRRQPIARRAAEREHIGKMLAAGIIEPSTSPWASGIVLVPKKDGKIRFCVDYRKLNSVTIRDSYPLPNISDCLDSLHGAVWFSSMDLCSGYWQVEMAPEDKHKTAFASRFGLYHFNVMPFGLTNAPSTFERLMDTVLRGLQWDECLVYLDDIIVPGSSVAESVERLSHVFNRLREAGLKLKPSKCNFFQKKVVFLGHVVSKAGVSTDPSKIDVVTDWPTPINVTQVRSFLGLCNYYRRFVKNYAKIADPLYKLIGKGDRNFKWTGECQSAFDTLKTALTTTPVLGYPSATGQYTLDTDASDHATGAVLSQEQNGQEIVIAYFSKALTKEERNYCITRKELLAVVQAVQHFRHYIYGTPTILRTDNAAVSWLRNLKDPAKQMARWLEHLETFDLKVVHRPGRKHGNADALSRRPCKQCGQHDTDLQDKNDQLLPVTEVTAEEPNKGRDSPKDSESSMMARGESATVRVTTRSQQKENSTELRPQDFLLDGWDPVEIRSQQQADTDMAVIMAALVDHRRRPTWQDISAESTRLKTLWRQWDRLCLKGGLLYRKWFEDDGTFKWQLVVPQDKRREILWHFHDCPTGGHLGVERTLQKIRNNFYWVGLKDNVQVYCKRCDKCAARKKGVAKKAPLRQYTVGTTMERMAVDILGPLPQSRRGNKYIMVVADHFTKWVEAFAIPNQTAETIARVLVEEVVCRFGVPLQLHSDQGTNFESQLFKDMCKLLGVEKTRTTGLHPQSDGLVERYNRTLLTMLTMYVQDDQQTWDEILPYVMMAYRASRHESTGKTPNLLMLGREVNLPLNAVVASPAEEDGEAMDYDDHVSALQKRLRDSHEVAREHLKGAAIHQKKQYDHKAGQQDLKEGQPVWLWDPSRKRGISPKLTSNWKGPLVIVQRIDDLLYRVQRGPRAKPKVVHINRLRPYEGENPPTWYKPTPTK